MILTFERVEEKFLLDKATYEEIIGQISPYLKIDSYGWQEICSLYCDNDANSVIRRSMENKDYKEKLRIRSYGVVKPGGNAFVEFKKKFKGTVYKRRICVPYELIEDLMYGRIESIQSVRPDIPTYADLAEDKEKGRTRNRIGELPAVTSPMVEKELQFYVKQYDISPKIYLGYRRVGYFSPSGDDLRITFDTDILSRRYDVTLEKGFYGDPYFTEPMYLMEIKSCYGIPLWLTKILTQHRLFARGFSKYGRVFSHELTGKRTSVSADPDITDFDLADAE
jgi:hypothetical protein